MQKRLLNWLVPAGCLLALGPVLMSLVRVRPPVDQPAPAPPDQAAAEWFEERVRPVLIHRCGDCHSGPGGSGGLDLLSESGVHKGGARGPAVIPGDPEGSLLIQAVRQASLKMPPSGKLPDTEIADLTTWVRQGAWWPVQTLKDNEGRMHGASTGAGPAHPSSFIPPPSQHWAFRPVVRPAVPEVKDRGWVKTPVDAFVLARLEAAGLRPSPPATRRDLIRRGYYDLTGLPPTPEQVEAYERDPSPDAWAKVVDQLLASPRYGERWGRYWLDLARYADTRDYVYYGERRFPFSYTYRDYVIQAFNEDKPYNQFLVEQIAADCLPASADRSRLAALGFLTLGRRFVNNPADVVDDRIDVVFRTTQGLTVTCARCHDHKYDPIPTQDYYSLYGVFAGSTEATVPLETKHPDTPAFRAYEAERARRKAVLTGVMERRRAELSDRLRRQVGAYLARVAEAGKLPDVETYLVMNPDDVNPILVRRWRAYINQQHPDVFTPWRAFEALPPREFSRKASALARRIARNTGGRLHPRVAALFSGPAPTSMMEVAARYGALLRNVYQAENHSRSGDPLRDVLFGSGSPATVPAMPVAETESFYDEKVRKELNALQARLDGWYLKSPETPPHALVLQELPHPPAPHIFTRGNPANPGIEVPRQFLSVLAGPQRKPFRHGSGRLELARMIADPRNPLTARVMVNRIWQGHFGRGIVTTPSNFGTRGDAPTHPELLDFLAAQFAGVPGSGFRVPRLADPNSKPGTRNPELKPWSIKSLHRLIMLSSVYQQSGEDQDAGRRIDPENDLLWKMSPRRLDFEALRDTLLAVSGRLDLRAGGRGVDLTTPETRRRTVYGLVDRQKLPGLFRVFDFPNPDRHNSQRYVTTSPQQALFLMNNPFVQQCAAGLAARVEASAPPAPPARIRALYRLLYYREPSSRQLQLGLRFVGDGSRTAWERYAQALLLTNELAFIN